MQFSLLCILLTATISLFSVECMASWVVKSWLNTPKYRHQSTLSSVEIISFPFKRKRNVIYVRLLVYVHMCKYRHKPVAALIVYKGV